MDETSQRKGGVWAVVIMAEPTIAVIVVVDVVASAGEWELGGFL